MIRAADLHHLRLVAKRNQHLDTDSDRPKLARQEFDHAVGVDRQTDVGRPRQDPRTVALQVLAIERHPVECIGCRVGDDAAVQVLQIFSRHELRRYLRGEASSSAW